MSRLWGSMSGPQIVEMGMNIFSLAQQQAKQKREEEATIKQLTLENMFKKQQLDMQQQRIDFEGQRLEQQKEIDLQNIQTAKDRSEYFKMQKDEALQTKQKLGEYSMKLGEMLETLDFSKPEDMKKLYAFQTQYTPYGVNAQYIKPVVAGGGMAQDEYGKFVSSLYQKLMGTSQNEYNKAFQKYLQDLKAWESSGIMGMGKGEKPIEPEFALPDVNQVKELADQMLQKGIKIDDLLQPKFEEKVEAKPVQPTKDMKRLGTKEIPLSDMSMLEKVKLTAQPFTEMFSPGMREYNQLSSAERRVIDRYMKDARVDLNTAISAIKEARTRKMQ